MTVCPSCGTAASVSPPGDAGASDAARAPDAQCAADASLSLSGTVAISGFTPLPGPAFTEVSLYGLFPYGTEPSVNPTPQRVRPDGTWSYRCLSAGAHYYVRGVAHFKVGDAGTGSVPAIVGPLTVPSSGPVAVTVQPLQIGVREVRAAGSATRQLQWASVHVFDPATGAEVNGATVTIDVGGSVLMPVPWDPNAPASPAYYVQFVPSPAAQPSYTVTASWGTTSLSSKVVADPPMFDGTITSPSDGATVAVGMPLTVTWTAQPQADYEIVDLFLNATGLLTNKYTSPQPNGSALTQEPAPIPGKLLMMPGNYLLSVSYSKSNCPRDAAGCVHANTVSTATLLVK
jgi:hypothetical protein